MNPSSSTPHRVTYPLQADFEHQPEQSGHSKSPDRVEGNNVSVDRSACAHSSIRGMTSRLRRPKNWDTLLPACLLNHGELNEHALGLSPLTH